MDQPLEPADLRRAADFGLASLRPLVDRDWSQPGHGLTWSCRYTLEHTLAALDGYAGRLALRSPGPVPRPRPTETGIHLFTPYTLDDLLVGLEIRAAVLAEVARAAPAQARAWHPSGLADASGFVGMGCVEILTHTDDIARAFGREPEPPADLCRRTLTRLFPWAPATTPDWATLRWATGRGELVGHTPIGPDWEWHNRPLSEWDGLRPTS